MKKEQFDELVESVHEGSKILNNDIRVGVSGNSLAKIKEKSVINTTMKFLVRNSLLTALEVLTILFHSSNI